MDILVAGFEDGSIKIYDTEANKIVRHTQNVHKTAVTSAKIHESGISFVTTGLDGDIKIHSLQSKQTTNTLSSKGDEPIIFYTAADKQNDQPSSEIYSVALHWELPMLMSCGANGTVKILTNVEM